MSIKKSVQCKYIERHHTSSKTTLFLYYYPFTFMSFLIFELGEKRQKNSAVTGSGGSDAISSVPYCIPLKKLLGKSQSCNSLFSWVPLKVSLPLLFRLLYIYIKFWHSRGVNVSLSYSFRASLLWILSSLFKYVDTYHWNIVLKFSLSEFYTLFNYFILEFRLWKWR